MGNFLRKTFKGGYQFKNFQGEPENVLEDIAIPEHVIIPLKHGINCEVTASVNRGDTVFAGQIIGENDESISNPIHATISGTVEKIKALQIDGEKVKSVFITGDKQDKWQPIEGFNQEWQKLSNSEIETLIYKSGTAGLGNEGIPTNFNSSPITPDKVTDIIIHHTSSDLFNTNLSILLKDDGINEFVTGLEILQKLFSDVQFHLILGDSNKKQSTLLQEKLNNNISLYFVKEKYPQNNTALLLSTILNKKIQSFNSASEVGSVLLSIQDLQHVCRAVTQGKPLIERINTLAGTGFKKTPHINVRIGTLISKVMEQIGVRDKEIRFVLESPINGKVIDNLDYPISHYSEILIALPEKREGDLFSFSRPGIYKDSYSNTFFNKLLPFKKDGNTNACGDTRACFSCGFCADVCPVRILPNILHPYVEREKFNETPVQYGIFNCIDCNLCTYVCPSKIPLATLMKKGKKELAAEGFGPKGQLENASMQKESVNSK